MQNYKAMTVGEIANITNRSNSSVYGIARRLGMLAQTKRVPANNAKGFVIMFDPSDAEKLIELAKQITPRGNNRQIMAAKMQDDIDEIKNLLRELVNRPSSNYVAKPVLSVKPTATQFNKIETLITKLCVNTAYTRQSVGAELTKLFGDQVKEDFTVASKAIDKLEEICKNHNL